MPLRAISAVLLFLLVASVAVAQGDLSLLLEKHCLQCHNADDKEAEIDLSGFADADAFLQHRSTWDRAREVLLSQQMPPEDEAQPTGEERTRLIRLIESSLDAVDWQAVRSPGRVALARLTRDEYEASIEDLFDVRIDATRWLPADPEGLSGFDNDRSSMVMTAQQLSKYLKTAEVVADAILDASDPVPVMIHYEVEEGKNANWKKPVKRDPDGSHGWAFSSKLGNKYQAVSKSIDFPRTGRYSIRMRARSTGPGDQAAAWIAIDSVNDASREAGVLVTGKEFDVYETEQFVTRGRHTVLFGYDFYGSLWLPKPPERAQVKLGQSTFHPPPYDRTSWLPEPVTLADFDEHDLVISDDDVAEAEKLIGVINEGYFPAVIDHLMMHQFHYEKGYLPVFLGGLGYDYLENVVPAMNELAKLCDSKPPAIEKVWKSREPETLDDLRKVYQQQQKAWRAQDDDRKSTVGDLFVDWIEWEPIASSHELPAAGEVVEYLRRLAPRALRQRDVTHRVDQFHQIYSQALAGGVGHRESLRRMLIAILVSPEFLYRSDGPVDAPGVTPLSEEVLAARLAAFLWSSVPDQALNDAASQASLRTEDALSLQVDRMLDDPKRLRMSRSFTSGWLNLRDIGLEKEPDKELFRYFSHRLAEDMRAEVALLFDRIVREDRSLLELLDSDESFLNERLARLYGIEDVSGEHLRPVPLPDRSRGGLLGTAAVLTTTSLATRTSPVRRGQFVLETLLGVELPPPPPGVPQLDAQAGQTRVVSLRESLARHRDDRRCAGCHSKIDPLGFALEHYDWIGRYRTQDPAGPVDASGTLPGGRGLSGMEELKTYLRTECADEFVRSLTQAMLAYALGRELDYHDEHAVRSIVAEVREEDYRARTLIRALVQSYPFRYREVAPESEELVNRR